MSLKDELDRIIAAERRDLENVDPRSEAFRKSQRDRFAEIRPLLAELADAVDDAYVRVRMSDARVVIDVGDTPTDADLFEIDGRWELEPNPATRFVAEPGARAAPRKSGFLVWKTLYLRPLMDPDYLTWDRLEFDSGEEAFQYVFQDVARQMAHCGRREPATGDTRKTPPDVS